MGWPCREYTKTAENTSFCGELLSENDFKVVLANFCCYDHGAKASDAVQIKRLGQNKNNGVVQELTKTSNFIATPMKKGFLFFS